MHHCFYRKEWHEKQISKKFLSKLKVLMVFNLSLEGVVANGISDFGRLFTIASKQQIKKKIRELNFKLCLCIMMANKRKFIYCYLK